MLCRLFLVYLTMALGLDTNGINNWQRMSNWKGSGKNGCGLFQLLSWHGPAGYQQSLVISGVLVEIRTGHLRDTSYVSGRANVHGRSGAICFSWVFLLSVKRKDTSVTFWQNPFVKYNGVTQRFLTRGTRIIPKWSSSSYSTSDSVNIFSV